MPFFVGCTGLPRLDGLRLFRATNVRTLPEEHAPGLLLFCILQEKRTLNLTIFLSFSSFQVLPLLLMILLFRMLGLFQDEDPLVRQQIQVNLNPFILKNRHVVQHVFQKDLAASVAADDGSYLLADVVPEGGGPIYDPLPGFYRIHTAVQLG